MLSLKKLASTFGIISLLTASNGIARGDAFLDLVQPIYCAYVHNAPMLSTCSTIILGTAALILPNNTKPIASLSFICALANLIAMYQHNEIYNQRRATALIFGNCLAQAGLSLFLFADAWYQH